MMKQGIFKLIGMLIGELALAVMVFIILLFMQTYTAANLYLFQDFAILKYASGWDILWMALYLSGDALFFLLLFLLATEAVLWILRTMFVIAANGLSLVTHKEFDRFKVTVKKISILTVLQKLGIKTAKSGIIFYVVLMLFIFAVPFGSKKILEANTSFVYRVYVGDRLYSDESYYDMTNWIDEETIIDVTVNVGYADVHVYTLQDTTEAKVVVQYDRTVDLQSVSIDFNELDGSFQVDGNLAQETYDAMSDALIPQIEIYLPADVTIANLELTTTFGGDIVVNYVSAETLELTATNADISITSSTETIENFNLILDSSQFNIRTETANSMILTMSNSTGSLLLRNVTNQIDLDLTSSELDFFSTNSDSLIIHSQESSLNLIEVYASEISVTLERDTYRHSNSSEEGIDNYIIIVMEDANVELKGVTCDYQSPTE